MNLQSLISKPALGTLPPNNVHPLPLRMRSDAPPASSAPHSNREEKKALFESAELADQNFDNAKAVADAMLRARSVAIEKILLACGKGPFQYRGETVRIVKRKSDEGNRVIYFFRAISRTETEEID